MIYIIVSFNSSEPFVSFASAIAESYADLFSSTAPVIPDVAKSANTSFPVFITVTALIVLTLIIIQKRRPPIADHKLRIEDFNSRKNNTVI